MPLKKDIAISVVAVLLAIPSISDGQTKDGNNLLAECGPLAAYLDDANRPPPRADQVAYCDGLMHGIVGMNFTFQDLFRIGLFCLPADKDGRITRYSTPYGQLWQIVVKWLRDHPEQLHQQDISLVILAIGQVFSCKK